MKKIVLLFITIMILGFGFGAVANAQSPSPAATPVAGSQQAVTNCSKGFLGFPTWYKYLELSPDCDIIGPKLVDPADPSLAGTTHLDMTKVATRVILAVFEMLLRVAGIITFGYIVYAGFLFVMSNGDSNKAKQARETIINAAIGMIISIFAVVIVSFIGNSLK